MKLKTFGKVIYDVAVECEVDEDFVNEVDDYFWSIYNYEEDTNPISEDDDEEWFEITEEVIKNYVNGVDTPDLIDNDYRKQVLRDAIFEASVYTMNSDVTEQEIYEIDWFNENEDIRVEEIEED